MYYPPTQRHPYNQPPRIYPNQIFGYRQQFYAPQVPQFYQQTFSSPYNGFQIHNTTKPRQPIVINQPLQSPQKLLQSPNRGFASPSRTNLMQSQQQSQPKQNSVLQSPTRAGFYTYEQVMVRISNANAQQQQQNQQSQQQTRQFQPNKNSINPSCQLPTGDTQQLQSGQIENKNNNNHEKQRIETNNFSDDLKQPKEIKNEENEELQELALQYEDGYIYRGQGYLPQTREGFGMLTDNEGREVYAGYWKQNFYEGQGRLYNLSVEQIKDAFDCNNMTTIGNFWLSYEGQFAGGKMHGQGMLVLSNGEKYIGEFDDGMIHGDGEFTTLQNEVIKGNWDQGYLVEMNEG